MSKNSDYAMRMKSQLDQWDADVDALVAEGAKRSIEVRTACEAQVRALRVSRDTAREAFQKLRAASESVSAQMHDGMQDAWEGMQHALKKATTDLRK